MKLNLMILFCNKVRGIHFIRRVLGDVMFLGSRKICHPKGDDINLASNVFGPGDDL